MRAAVFLLLMLLAPFCKAQDAPAFVVATPDLQGFYRGAVMVAVPFPAGGHVGVILNRPTKIAMGEVFPEHAPSEKVTDPIYVGGPASSDALFALVKSGTAPSPKAIAFTSGVWLVFESSVIDAVIEATPNDARYFVGMVLWNPGELAEELKKGFFVVRPADPEKFFLKDTSQLHEMLAPKKGVIGI